MKYILDTSAIMHYIKKGAVFNYMTDILDIFNSQNELLISIVTQAELESIRSRAPFDRKRQLHFDQIMSYCSLVPIDNKTLKAYVEIDTFSHGKHLTKILEEPIEKMGKNDIWIAATAMATKAKLVTIDSDFTHLDTAFIDLILLSKRGELIPMSEAGN